MCVSGARLCGVQLTETDDHTMLRRVSRVLQGYREQNHIGFLLSKDLKSELAAVK